MTSGASYDKKVIWTRLIRARTDVEANVNSSYDDVLRGVIAAVAARGSIGKYDIGALIFWKRLRADTPWVRALHAWPDNDVRRVTAIAVAATRDVSLSLVDAAKQGRSALSPLPGFQVGDALASSLLFAAAPDRMAVYDRRAQAGLESMGIALSAARGRYGRYIGLIDQLLQRAPTSVRKSWRPRDVDMALYWLGG